MPTVETQLPTWSRRLWLANRFKGIHGGRGSAKSHSVATALLLQGAERPLRILCTRETQRSIRDSSKRLLDDKIAALGLSSFYQSLETEIRGANGTLIVFAGLRSNIASVKSMEGIDRCWIEEAQSISKASLEVLIPTIRAPDSEIWATWNPEKPDDPIDELLRSEEPPPNSDVWEVNFDQNPWFPDNLRAQMEWDRGRDPEKYAHVWLGAYQRKSEARVFKNWRVAKEQDLAAFDRADPDRVYRFGADWGFSVDPSVLVRCWLEERTLHVDHEAYAVGCPIDQLPALFAGSDARGRWANPAGFPGVEGAHLWPIIADSARPETIDYMKARGFHIEPAVKGAGSVEDGVEFLQSVDIVVHPRCKHVIDELTFYSWKTDPHTEAVLPVLADKDNHTIDALRYALEAVRRGMGSLVSVAVAPRSSRQTVNMWGAGAGKRAAAGGVR